MMRKFKKNCVSFATSICTSFIFDWIELLTAWHTKKWLLFQLVDTFCHVLGWQAYLLADIRSSFCQFHSATQALLALVVVVLLSLKHTLCGYECSNINSILIWRIFNVNFQQFTNAYHLRSQITKKSSFCFRVGSAMKAFEWKLQTECFARKISNLFIHFFSSQLQKISETSYGNKRKLHISFAYLNDSF